MNEKIVVDDHEVTPKMMMNQPIKKMMMKMKKKIKNGMN
jgi:hypothetical protein